MSGSFSTTIDLALAKKLQGDLEEQGFALSKPPYTLFSAKKKGVSCTLYESGKLTVQGKEKDAFIEFYLEPEILKKLIYTNPDLPPPHIGMDEAGKGDFFGPLCIAAAYADEAGMKLLKEMGVKDSKTFSDGSILKLAKKLRAAFPYTVIRLFPKKYNELYIQFKNLNVLLAWAHAAALESVSAKTGCKQAILDQFANKKVVEGFLKRKKMDIELEQRTKAEEDLVVAAASILARAAFLEGLEELGREVEMELPKGAGEIVPRIGKLLVTRYGAEILGKVAKLHFKTTQAILGY